MKYIHAKTQLSWIYGLSQESSYSNAVSDTRSSNLEVHKFIISWEGAASQTKLQKHNFGSRKHQQYLSEMTENFPNYTANSKTEVIKYGWQQTGKLYSGIRWKYSWTLTELPVVKENWRRSRSIFTASLTRGRKPLR